MPNTPTWDTLAPFMKPASAPTLLRPLMVPLTSVRFETVPDRRPNSPTSSMPGASTVRLKTVCPSPSSFPVNGAFPLPIGVKFCRPVAPALMLAPRT